MSLPFLVSHSELIQHFSTFDTRGKKPKRLESFSLIFFHFFSLFFFESRSFSLTPSFPKLSSKSDSLSFPSTSNHTVCLPPSPSLCSSSLLWLTTTQCLGPLRTLLLARCSNNLLIWTFNLQQKLHLSSGGVVFMERWLSFMRVSVGAFK